MVQGNDDKNLAIQINYEELKMNNITLQKAKEFMYRNARPLDLARFQYHLENGSKETVINVLSYYQNEVLFLCSNLRNQIQII